MHQPSAVRCIYSFNSLSLAQQLNFAFCRQSSVINDSLKGCWGGVGGGGRERENVSVALLKTLTPGPCVSATQSTFYFPDIPCAITCARAALDLTDIEL